MVKQRTTPTLPIDSLNATLLMSLCDGPLQTSDAAGSLRPIGAPLPPCRPRYRPFRALQAATGSHFTCHRRPRRTTPPPSPPPSRHPRRRNRRRPCYRRPRALTPASCSSHRTVSKEACDSTTKEQKVKYIDSLLASAPIAKQMNELIKQSYGHMKKKIVTPVVFEHLPETKNKKYFDECLDLLTAEDYAKVVAKVSPPRASPSLPPRHCFPLRRPQLNSPQPNCLELNGPHTIRATPLRRHCTLLAAPLMTSDDL